MIWFWGVLCALALVALFFQFIFWVDFDAGMKGLNVRVRLFKKELYTYHKKFGKDDEDDSELFDISTPETEPVEKSEAPKIQEAKPVPEKTPESTPEENKPADEKSTSEEAPAEEAPAEDKSEQASPAEEKPVESKTETVKPTFRLGCR